MKTMYRTSYNEEIEPVEVVRKTKHFITVQIPDGEHGGFFTRRDRIDSNFVKYFDTWLQAKNYLIGRTKNEIKKAEAYMHGLLVKLQTIKSMEEP